MSTYRFLHYALSPHYRSASLLAALALIPALGAQDLRLVMPEPVPQLVDPAAAPEPLSDFSKLKAVLGGAAAGEEVLVAELKRVVLLRDESQLGTITLAADQHYNLQDFPELDTTMLQSALDLFIGESVSRESILRLRLSISLLLAQEGRPFSVVYAPPQDITDGTLQVVVKESSVGVVRVEGAKYFSEASYLSRIDQKSGEPIDTAQLRTGIDRINSNSFRAASTRVEKGVEPGTTDIVIQTRERFPLRAFTGYNNTGTQSTTEDRYFAGLNWGNAFGLGHLLTVQWTADLESRYSRAISANYTADLPGNQSLTFFGAYSEVESVPAGGLSSSGTSWQVGLNHTIPLLSSGAYTHSLELGADFKVSDNNIEFALPPFIIPISDNLTQIVQARFGYRGTLVDDWGQTTFGLKVTASPGGLSGENTDAAFKGSRFGSTADYVYGNLDLTRRTFLGGALTGWEWMVTGQAQMSDRNLLGSEQVSGGGTGSVRGYEQGEVVGDNALFFSQELILPAWSGDTSLGGRVLRPYLFHDYARLWSVDKLPGEKPFNLHSVGVGLRAQFTTHASLQAAYGWQLRDSGSSDTGDNSRLHLSATLSF